MENWNERALQFLEEHGWRKQDENLIEHESFPMLEDISTKEGALKFVEGFYTKAWGVYKNAIEGMNILIKERQEELKKNAVVLEGDE